MTRARGLSAFRLGVLTGVVVSAMGPAGRLAAGPSSSCAQAVWELQNPLPQANTLYSVWGSSATDVFAVGGHGTIVHFDGSAWVTTAPITSAALAGVWGSAADDVYAVGGNGVIVHCDGAGWAFCSSPPINTLLGVWGTSRSDVYAVGEGGAVIHYGKPASVATAITAFDARADEGGVRLWWEIATDTGVGGFRIYRSEKSEGREILLNPGALIPAAIRAFIDRAAQPGSTYAYTLAVVGPGGEEVRSFPVDVQTAPRALFSSQNYPNPFTPATIIRFDLATEGVVTLQIHDARGALVRELYSGRRPPGCHEVEWNGANDRGERVASGVYFCRLAAGEWVLTRKMVLVD